VQADDLSDISNCCTHILCA